MSFIDLARATGIEIVQDGGTTFWTGEYGGNKKPNGPLKDKRIGVIVASEFSDYQAYYLVSYIGELGGICEFLLCDWVTWKCVRPALASKGVEGMWGLYVDPVAVVGGDKAMHYKSLSDADVKDYDAIVILGGHSADVMVTEEKVIAFVKAAYDNGAVMGAIGAGSMPFIRAGIMHGKRCTGNRVVDYMLRKIADYVALPVVTDGKMITAMDTVNSAEFLRALGKAFAPDFDDGRKDILKGKKLLYLAGEDYEDIELVAPVLEYLYRGLEIIIGTFVPPMRSRPALLGLDVVCGNYGTTVPFQEIPKAYYTIKKLTDIKMTDFDAVKIPGAFCPWNIVDSGACEWLKQAHSAGKILAVICHGPIPLAAADLVKGKKMTGWAAARDSVEIMGGTFNNDWAACIDGQMVSGRTPPEIPEMVDALTAALLGKE